jgi:hypothetical protein
MNTLIAPLLACMFAAPKPAIIEAGGLTIEARPQDRGVRLRMTDTGGLAYADGAVRYEIQPKDGARLVLSAELASANADGLTIRAAAAGIELVHEIRPRPDRDGFVETIRLRDTTERTIVIDDYRFGLRRPCSTAGNLHAVAVPFRRQADGQLHDWALADIEGGKATNSDWHNDPAVSAPQPVDSARGRLRSEGWILTDGRQGLLVAKYNQDHIEFSMLDWETGANAGLTLGGSSFALHREPESMQALAPGQWVQLGPTYYLSVDGDWPAGYERFRTLLNELGHGLSAEYNPPINWNELFDVGWYHSDRAALTQHWTRPALLREAEKAGEIGATLLYLDPGWEVCEGTSLWDTRRLGSVSDLVKQLGDQYRLKLGFRTIGRVYRDEYPHDWYIQHGHEARPYERPFLSTALRPEPVPTTGKDGARNLALLPQARASASATLPGYEIHKPEHLNDGWYDNPASWVSGGEPSWAQIDLGAVYEINRICFGSEHTPRYNDRAATHVRILLATKHAEGSSDSRWQMVAECKDRPIHGTMCFDFSPQHAQYVRIEILASAGGNARIDEIEVYEARPQPWTSDPRRRAINTTQPAGTPINFWEVCTLNPAWQAEKLMRLIQIAEQGMRFAMFDEFDWRGPCYCREHGHAVPSTPEGHVRAVYGLIRKLKRHVPGLLVEAHDPVWPWGVRYLPVYFGQTTDPARRDGCYEENWGFEFMWNPIDDLVSGRALCLYYYNLGCDIPLYDHITMENDNDACLAFWWYASTVRHLGIGGKKGLGSKTENEARWRAYKVAMQQYLRLRDWFVRGRFVGIDELDHLHVLVGKPGGVLVAFNLADKPVDRKLAVKPADLGLAARGSLPTINAAGARWTGAGQLELRFTIPARSPAVIEIGIAPVSASDGRN